MLRPTNGIAITRTGNYIDVGINTGGIVDSMVTGISAAKIGTPGSVSDTEFNYLSNITSDVQGQLTSLLNNRSYDYLALGTPIAGGTPIAVGSTTLFVNGSMSLYVRTEIGGATVNISATDNVVLFNTSVSSTATLPTAVGNTGKQIILKNIHASYTITLATTSSEYIDGAAPALVLGAQDTVTLLSNGTDWSIISYYNAP